MTLPTEFSRQPTLHEWSSFRMELLWVYRGRVKSYDRQRTVRHGYGNWLWLLEEGEVEVESFGKRLHAKKGQWILCPEGESVQQFSEQAEILSIRFLCQWPTGENLFLRKEGFVFDADSHPRLAKKALPLLWLVEWKFPGSREALFEQHSDIETFLILQNRFPVFLLELVKILVGFGHELAYARTLDNRVALAIRSLNNAVLDQPFPLEYLLQVTGLSWVHLNRMMRDHIGMTGREYWDKRREDTACYRLEATEEPVKAIGFDLGFKQASHFTNWFKRRVGQSPLAYRRQEATARLTE